MRKVIWILVLFTLLCFTTQAFADSKRGKKLFKEKRCVLCHDITLPGTVFKPICPGLKGVKARHNKLWIKKWLQNPAKVWAGKDKDVQDILKRYFEYRGSKPKPRESFMATVIGKQVHLTDEEIDDLIEFLWTL